MHRVDMGFIKTGRSYSSVKAIDKKSDYYNFYLGYIPEGREEVPLYERLIYSEVYEGIDLMLSSNGVGAKYYFICKPGSNPDSISLNFTGQSNLNLLNESLHIKTSLEDIILPQATAFQIDGNGNSVPLIWAPTYSINGGEVTFSSGNYNSSQTLVFQITLNAVCSNIIDENGSLNWSTFYHDTAGSWSTDIASSPNEESIYITGIAFDNIFPVIGMDVDLEFGGVEDAYVVKFNLNYQRQWATFYGGSESLGAGQGTDESYSIAVDENENVYFTGRTNSSDFPTFATGAAYEDDTIDEYHKAFLVKLNGQFGSRMWATLFGNNLNPDVFNSRSGAVGINKDNHVFISGQLLTSGASGPGYGVEINDNMGTYYSQNQGSFFIAEFDENNDIEWSTMFGRNLNFTYIHDMVFDSEKNLFLVGFINNADVGNLIGHTFVNPGQAHFQNTAQGSDDGIIIKFDKDTRQPIWSTLFGGAEDDQIYAAEIGNDDNLYIYGSTLSDKNTFPVLLHPDDDPNIVYYDDIINGRDLFIGRFTETGEKNWVTYYGGNDDEYAFHGLTFTENENIYITGSTLSPDFNIEQYQDFYHQPGLNQPDPDGTPILSAVPDAFIVSFHSNKEILASTFFGGNNSVASGNLGEIGTSLTAVGNKIYMAGNVRNSLEPCFPTLEPSGTGVWFFPTYDDSNSPTKSFIGEFGDVDHITAVEELVLEENNKIEVIPNPARSNLTVSINLPHNLITGNIEITDMTGRSRINLVGVSEKIIELDISELPSGTYLLTYRDNKNLLTKKFVVIH